MQISWLFMFSKWRFSVCVATFNRRWRFFWHEVHGYSSHHFCCCVTHQCGCDNLWLQPEEKSSQVKTFTDALMKWPFEITWAHYCIQQPLWCSKYLIGSFETPHISCRHSWSCFWGIFHPMTSDVFILTEKTDQDYLTSQDLKLARCLWVFHSSVLHLIVPRLQCVMSVF